MLPLLLPLLALPAIAAEVQCDYGRDGSCINTRASATTEFSLPPVFPNAKFVYAVDDLNPDELMALGSYPSRKSVENLKASMNGWWLEYDTVTLDSADYLMDTDVSLLLTNKTASDANNGCESVLGATCLKDLEEALLESWESQYQYHLSPVYELINHLNGNAPPKSCPEDLFKATDTPPTAQGFAGSYIAREITEESTANAQHRKEQVRPAGNASAPYSRNVYPGQSLPMLIGQTAIAILMRYPMPLVEATYAAGEPTRSDVTVQFVCAKIEDDGSYDQEEARDDGDDGDDDEGAAGLVGVPKMLLSSLVAGALWVWI